MFGAGIPQSVSVVAHRTSGYAPRVTARGTSVRWRRRYSQGDIRRCSRSSMELARPSGQLGPSDLYRPGFFKPSLAAHNVDSPYIHDGRHRRMCVDRKRQVARPAEFETADRDWI